MSLKHQRIFRFLDLFFSCAPARSVSPFGPVDINGQELPNPSLPHHTWHVVVGQHRDRHVVLLLQETHV